MAHIYYEILLVTQYQMRLYEFICLNLYAYTIIQCLIIQLYNYTSTCDNYITKFLCTYNLF